MKKSYYSEKKIITLKATMIVAFSLLFLFFQKTPVLAYKVDKVGENNEGRFILAPTKIEAAMEPGEKRTEKIRVVNRLGQQAKFYIKVEDFTGSDDPEKATIFLGNELAQNTSAARWIKPEMSEFELNHGERMEMEMEIEVPESAEPGGHYAAIFVATKGDKKDENDQVISQVSRVGTLCLLTVKGDLKKEGSLFSFKSLKNFYFHGPVGFESIFKNEGNIHLKPKGQINITNMFGTRVGQLEAKELIVLPQSQRKQETRWNRKWLWGKYTAQLELAYDGEKGEQKAAKEITFYAFPVVEILIGLLILFIVSFLFRHLFRSFSIVKKRK